MGTTPNYMEFARQSLEDAEPELVAQFGRERLEETAFTVYTNKFPPASYMGWSRVAHAQRLLGKPGSRELALDFGSGLGVMLPFLSQRYDKVVAFDVDGGPTKVMVEHMRLANVTPATALTDEMGTFDAVVALDVLEHVTGLDEIYADMLARTSPGGCWVISGPTENWLYRFMRRVAGTSGEGHIRTVDDVLDAVPSAMRRTDTIRLPFGSPVPLFVVARFERS